MAVHGRGRAVIRIHRAFAPSAARAGLALLAPLFAEPLYQGYQRLGGASAPLKAADHMLRVLDEVIDSTGVDPRRVALFGYSGGAQFAHRFAMLYPQRFQALVIAGSGWYTWPDPLVAYPYGTAPSVEAPSGLPALREYVQLPIAVMVGDRDTERGSALRSSTALDTLQGATRRERAERYVEAIQRAAQTLGVHSRAQLEVLPQTAHSFRHAVERGRLVERTLGFVAAYALVEDSAGRGEAAA